MAVRATLRQPFNGGSDVRVNVLRWERLTTGYDSAQVRALARYSPTFWVPLRSLDFGGGSSENTRDT